MLVVLFMSITSSSDVSDARVKIQVTTTSSSSNIQSKIATPDQLILNSGSITIREVVFDGDNGKTS